MNWNRILKYIFWINILIVFGVGYIGAVMYFTGIISDKLVDYCFENGYCNPYGYRSTYDALSQIVLFIMFMVQSFLTIAAICTNGFQEETKAEIKENS